MSSISDRLIQSNAGKLPELLKLRYNFMAENAFRFYRGSCALFYDDLSKAAGLPGAPAAWISGDLHLENFGAFRGGNRLVYFDLNDFDESALAPATWEVLRLVTSIFIAFDSLDIDEEQARRVAELYLSSYSATLAAGKAIYIEPQTAKGIVCDFLTKASRKKAKRLLKKRTVKEDHQLVVETDDPRHHELDSFTKRELMHHLTEWIIYSKDGPYNYEVRDVAFRVAGTGSVGQRRYMFLLQSLLDDKDYLLVDMKQASAPSLKPYLALPQPEWESDAHRIVGVQQRMQNVAPALLSPTVFKEEAYILQELQPVKDSISFHLLKDRYRDMREVIDSMAVLTASSQLRSSGRQGSAIADELMAFGVREDWQPVVMAYAQEYARQMRDYYKQFLQDLAQGAFVPAARHE